MSREQRICEGARARAGLSRHVEATVRHAPARGFVGSAIGRVERELLGAFANGVAATRTRERSRAGSRGAAVIRGAGVDLGFWLRLHGGRAMNELFRVFTQTGRLAARLNDLEAHLGFRHDLFVD